MRLVRLNRWSVVVVFSLLALGGEALAQETTPTVASSQTAKTPSAVVFLTEDWSDDKGQRNQSFWWKTPDKPQYSALDKILYPALKKQGVLLPVLPPNAPFSTVYRRAHMAPTNAAALLTLVGQKQALVGSVIYRTIASQDPFAKVGMQVIAKVLVVQAGQTTFDLKKMITVKRTVFTQNAPKAMTHLRKALSTELSGVLARTLKQRQGSVGVVSQERLIVLQGVKDHKRLQAIQQRLLQLEQISEVRVKWAASGHIALEINPKKQDNEDIIEQATRTLIQHDFKPTGFRIAKARSATSQLSMLKVEAVIEESLETTP